jgi:hypothetical protein
MHHAARGADVSLESKRSQNHSSDQYDDKESWRDDDQDSDIIPLPGVGNRDSFLSMDVNSPVTPYTARYENPQPFGISPNSSPLLFSNTDELLDFATRNWREKLVTLDVKRRDVLEEFSIRPFFLLINIDAPILMRYERYRRCVR